jgi:hypothetical protein
VHRRSILISAVALSLASCQPPPAAPPAPCPPPSGAPVATVAATATATATAQAAADPPDPRAGLPKELIAAADKIAAAAQTRRAGYEWLVKLTDTYGNRLSGSAALERAIDYAVESMKKAGLANARREKVMVPHWVRGKESARVTAPLERELVMLGLGGSVGTGAKPIKAEVLVVESLAALKAAGDKLKGKIVLVNQPMPAFDPTTNETGYGTTVGVRWSSANEAGKLGAVAALVRSVSAKSFRTAHTGAMAPYAKDGPKIPAAAIAAEDADYLARAAQKGPVTVELSMGAKTLPDAESANAIAELRGRELPDEIVVVGGHIDSWDVGEGANDDGAGCAMAMDAAVLLKELGLVPKRTVRVVMFTNEENGGRGSKGYLEAHGGEKHAAAIEADFGAGAPRGFQVKAAADFVAKARGWMPLFSGTGATELKEGHAGADVAGLGERGTPSLGLVPDGSRYFDVHHSAADTIDKIDPVNLQKNAAALALMAYLAAET